jgi:hypothetical protein
MPLLYVYFQVGTLAGQGAPSVYSHRSQSGGILLVNPPNPAVNS